MEQENAKELFRIGNLVIWFEDSVLSKEDVRVFIEGGILTLIKGKDKELFVSQMRRIIKEYQNY